MPMVRAMRMMNAIEAGTLNGAGLQALLVADPGRLAEFNQMISMRGQARRLAASSTAFAAVLASSTAFAAVLASPTAFAAVLASSTAMTAVAASSTAFAAVLASSTAFAAVLASPTAFAAVLASSTAMTAVAASSTAMTAVYQSPTAMAAIAPTGFAVYGPHDPLITLSGNEVTLWRNAMNPGTRDFVGANSGGRPTFNGVAANGYTSLNFDGSNDVLHCTSAFNLSTSYTAWIVFRANSNNNNVSLIGDGGSTSNASSSGDGIVFRNGTLYTTENSSTTNRGSAYTHPAGQFGLLRLRRRATSEMYIRLNGNDESGNLSGNIPNFASANVIIGDGRESNVAGNAFHSGQIAEIFFITDGGNSGAGGESAEITRIHNMLRTKYAL